MPPKRNQNRSKSRDIHLQKSKELKANAMEDCVFQLDIMLCILTFLPVKLLLRFKSVCKSWRNLLATPKFMKMHHDQLSSDPRNESFIIYSLSEYCDHTMSLLSVESNEKKPMNLEHPYLEIFFRMDFVGCCNGLLCMGCPPLGKVIVLWNPALKMSKFVRLSKLDFGVPEILSLGFGYDDEDGDFKVLRSVCLQGKKMRIGVEVYSVELDSWKTIKVGFQFRVLRTKKDAIVNGNPYWVAKIDENESFTSQLGEILICFDMKKLEFKMVPLATLKLEEGAEVTLVDWKGSLAGIVCSKKKERVDSVDVWMFDDGEMIWRKNHTFGPIEARVDRLLQCSKNGKIIGERVDGKLFVFHPDTGCVKVIEIEARKHSFEIYGYGESLAYVKGMEQVVVKMVEEEEEDDPMAGPAVDIEGFFMSCPQLHGCEVVGNNPLAF